MKHIAIAAAAAAAFAMLGTAAQAQTAPKATTSPLYGEIGYTMLNVKAEDSRFKPKALRGIVGYEFHRNVAVEGMLAFGVTGSSTTIFEPGIPADINLNVKLKNAYGVYVKPKFDVTPQFEVFGRLGYTESKFKVSAEAAGFSESESAKENGFSYGLGLAYRFDPRMSLGLDYMVYSNKNGTKVDGVSLNFGYRF